MAENKKIPTSIVLFWAGVVLVLLMGAVLGIFWSKLPPQLPWLYSFPFGEKQLINKFFFVFVFVGTEVMLFLTRLIANWAGKNDETVQNTIMTGVLAAVVLMAASFFRIMMIFLNI
jgi:hypothetical protein